MYIQMDKTVIKFGDTEIGKQPFSQRKFPISTENININKTVVPEKVSFDQKGQIFQKNLNLHVYFFEKRVHIEETLMKLNMSFFIKNDELLEEYNQIREKDRNSIKK